MKAKRWGVYDLNFSIWLVEHDGQNSEWTKDPKRAWKGTEEQAKAEAVRITQGPRQFAGMGTQSVAAPIPS